MRMDYQGGNKIDAAYDVVDLLIATYDNNRRAGMVGVSADDREQYNHTATCADVYLRRQLGIDDPNELREALAPDLAIISDSMDRIRKALDDRHRRSVIRPVK